jgi:LysM repeat protein
MVTRSVSLDVDEAVYQQALTKARAEGQTLADVLATLLTEWAGPVSAPVPMPTPEPAPTPAQPSRTYTVQPGDTLGAIARNMYGSAAKYPIIAEANNITDPRRLWVGKVLIIPPLPEAPSEAPPQAPAPTLPPTSPTPSVPVPGAPTITWVGSPNFNRRPDPNDIWAIVIHATANSSQEGVISWFNNPTAQVSAHYSIGKDGRIVQHVRDEDRAWHAGKSQWQGVDNVNDFALGIELVNLNDGQDPFPEAQHEANVQLCAYLCRQHSIRPENIVGHEDIAVPAGRKTDPRGYDLDRLRREVTTALAA